MLLLVLVLPILFILPASAIKETEPNDSLDSPQEIGEGIIEGELNTNLSDGELMESDIFKVDIPRNSIVFFLLKKTAGIG